jgi:hypothetical protein
MRRLRERFGRVGELEMGESLGSGVVGASGSSVLTITSPELSLSKEGVSLGSLELLSSTEVRTLSCSLEPSSPVGVRAEEEAGGDGNDGASLA